MTKYLFTLILFLSLLLPCGTQGQIITTIAGIGSAGFSGDNNLAIACELSQPRDIEVDDSGNVFIADQLNFCVRKIDKNGIITTIAGIGGSAGYSGDHGPAVLAQMSAAYSIAIDRKHNLYIADEANHCIRKVDTAGIITTVAGGGGAGFYGDSGAATAALLSSPAGVTADKYGYVYICDVNNNRIRMVDTAGIITTIAGTGAIGYGGDNGPATSAILQAPAKITVDTSGNIYFSDGGFRVRKIDITGIITTIAGTGIAGPINDGGPATNASLLTEGVKADKYGNIFLADYGNNRIRKINANGIITTVAGCGFGGFGGDNGPATSANIYRPTGIAVDSAGHLFIADMLNFRVRSTRLGVGIDDVFYKKNSLSLYPNPCNGTFSIVLPDKQNLLKLSLTDVLGREAKTGLTGMTDRQTEVSLDAPDGIYFISAITTSGTYFEKIIVKR